MKLVLTYDMGAPGFRATERGEPYAAALAGIAGIALRFADEMLALFERAVHSCLRHRSQPRVAP